MRLRVGPRILPRLILPARAGIRVAIYAAGVRVDAAVRASIDARFTRLAVGHRACRLSRTRVIELSGVPADRAWARTRLAACTGIRRRWTVVGGRKRLG